MEQKYGDVVRRHAFHYRHDTAAELKLLNALYALVRVRLNLLILTGAKAAELAELMETTNPADLTRGITKIQTQLIALDAAKTRALEASSTQAQNR